MKYIILTVQWCKDHNVYLGSSTRYSIDGQKCILPYKTIEVLLREEPTIKVYWHDSKELNDVLNSSEWTQIEDEENVNREDNEIV